MKNSKTKKSKRAAAMVMAAEPGANPWIWIYAASLGIALFAAFEVYWPAIHGPFLLDDTYLTYMRPDAAYIPLRDWLRQTRPLLLFTFWLNYQQSGAQDTFSYHAVNVLLHFFNTIFSFLAVRKVLSWASPSWASMDDSRTRILSLFAAGLFLLHPLQTESVSYVASRSETLSVFFVLAALVVYLYRKTAVVSVPRILALWRSVRGGGTVQGAHRRSSGPVYSHRLLLEIRILPLRHLAELEIVSSHRGRRRFCIDRTSCASSVGTRAPASRSRA